MAIDSYSIILEYNPRISYSDIYTKAAYIIIKFGEINLLLLS